MRTRPFDFRFSGPEFWAKSQGAARKTNISRQYRTEVTFQSWTVSSFRVKNREILVAQLRYRTVYYPKTTRCPETPRVSSSALPLASFYRLSHSMCAENYFTSALARLPRQWALKIFIFWARGSSDRAVDLKGDRLISLRGDNGPDGTARF